MQFNKHAVVLFHGRERQGMPAVRSLLSAEERVSHYLLTLPLSFNSLPSTNYDGMTVLKQREDRAIGL